MTDQLPTAPPPFYRYEAPTDEEQENMSPEEVRAKISSQRVMQEIQDVRDILAGEKNVPRAKPGPLKMPDVIALKIRMDSAFRLFDTLVPKLKSVEAVPEKRKGMTVRRLDGSTPKPGDDDYNDEEDQDDD